MSDIYEKALAAHKEWHGKLEIHTRAKVTNKEELALAYSPGVAAPCKAIAKDPESIYEYTWKHNAVAVVTDGTAVLGLGDIGPKAALPVMEGKAILFKEFAGVDAVPICLDTTDVDEIVQTVKLMAPGFGGINLEDIAAPRCVEIERRLIEELDIPVFHDDQHGTAIVVIAALINALKVAGKEKSTLKVVVLGAGAAGSSIIKMLTNFGVGSILAYHDRGIITKSKSASYDFLTKEIAAITNPEELDLSLSEGLKGADVLIGVSAANLVTEEMVRGMNERPIIFAMANPEPEIAYDAALAAGAFIVGTGRSDYPNQINNVLAFPGLFRGAFTVRASRITENMKLAAAEGIAAIIPESQLDTDYIIPSAFDPAVAATVAKKVATAAAADGVARL